MGVSRHLDEEMDEVRLVEQVRLVEHLRLWVLFVWVRKCKMLI